MKDRSVDGDDTTLTNGAIGDERLVGAVLLGIMVFEPIRPPSVSAAGVTGCQGADTGTACPRVSRKV